MHWEANESTSIFWPGGGELCPRNGGRENLRMVTVGDWFHAILKSRERYSSQCTDGKISALKTSTGKRKLSLKSSFLHTGCQWKCKNACSLEVFLHVQRVVLHIHGTLLLSYSDQGFTFLRRWYVVSRGHLCPTWAERQERQRFVYTSFLIVEVQVFASREILLRRLQCVHYLMHTISKLAHFSKH